MLSTGIKTPDFTLEGKDGKEVGSSSSLGRKTALYFYSKDSIPRCTRKACAFADAYIGSKQGDMEVIDVNRDNEKSHAGSAAKHELPSILLFNPEPVAIQAYNVRKERRLHDKVSMGVVGSTYVIDENGVIEGVFGKVEPDTNVQEMLDYLDSKVE